MNINQQDEDLIVNRFLVKVCVQGDRGILAIEVAQIKLTEGNYDGYNAH